MKPPVQRDHTTRAGRGGLRGNGRRKKLLDLAIAPIRQQFPHEGARVAVVNHTELLVVNGLSGVERDGRSRRLACIGIELRASQPERVAGIGLMDQIAGKPQSMSFGETDIEPRVGLFALNPTVRPETIAGESLYRDVTAHAIDCGANMRCRHAGVVLSDGEAGCKPRRTGRRDAL